MEKTRKNWLITGLLAIAFVFTMGFAFLGMPANTMTAYAATERVVATLRASNALNSNGSSGLWSWEMTGSTTVSYTWDTTLNDYVNAVSLPASNPESLFIVRWSNPNGIKITKVVVSAREASGHMKYNQLYFNGDDTASYSNKSTVDNVTTYTQREGREDNGVMRFRVGNNDNVGMSDAVFNIKSITIYAEETTTPVTIDAGTGVKSVYLSTTNNATSGSASGTEFDDGATVYGFAELAKGYNAPSGWTLVGGTANTEGAKYRVGSVSAGSSNFGTKSADLATYTISYNLNGGAHGTTHPSSYNVTSNTFTISNPTRDGYTFKGWSGTGLSGDTNKNVSVAKGSIGNRTYTANWTANQYTITYNANDGEVSPASVTYKTNNNSNTATSQDFTLATPTRVGYTFDGWTTTKSGVSISNKTTLTINANIYGDFTVTANWTAKTYDLTFNNGEAQGGDAGVTATYDAMLPNVSVPTLDGYTFVGYYDQENGAGSSVVGGNKYIDSNGNGCKAWDKDSATPLYAYYTQNMVVAFDGYNAEYDRDFHTITVNPTNPTDAVVKYGTTSGTYNLTSAPTYKNVGVYTVYFEVTKAGWTTYRGSETVVISKTNAEYETLPEAIEGLIYNNEPLTLVSAASLKYNDAGNIVYRIEYTDPDTEQSYITDYSTTLPQGVFATEYTVYYKALGNSNYNPIAEDSFTVTIAQVDKEALVALIAKVDAYHEKIAEGYADADADMMAERTVSQESFIDKANVTSGQIAEQIEQLQTALSTAKIEVVTKKIEEIGNVERTKESKTLIDDAREYFDDLTEEEKSEIANVETLTESEEKYEKLVFDFNVTVSCATIFGFLGLCLIILTILYLIAMFKKNKWIIKDGKVVRAYVCKKIVPEGRKVITAGLKKTTRPENRIYDTKEEALAALENGEPTDEEQNVDTKIDSGNKFGSIKGRSFEEKLNDLSDDLRNGYNELKNEILGYNGTKANLGRGFEYITAGRTTLVKFAVKGKTLCVYYDLETEKLNSKYKVEKVESKKYASTPCLYRIKNNRRLNYAKELIALVAKEQGLAK